MSLLFIYLIILVILVVFILRLVLSLFGGYLYNLLIINILLWGYFMCLFLILIFFLFDLVNYKLLKGLDLF